MRLTEGLVAAGLVAPFRSGLLLRAFSILRFSASLIFSGDSSDVCAETLSDAFAEALPSSALPLPF